MKQEVIQDFLNLPGIAGVALMDRRSRPYFCGVDQNLNFQQKEALAQGILQVVETIPDGFESFKYQFAGHQVHIYKLDHGIILLVLTRDDLVYSDYLQTIKNLKAALREDIANAIATFRLIAGNITLTNTSYQKPNVADFKKLSQESTPSSSNYSTSIPSLRSAPASSSPNQPLDPHSSARSTSNSDSSSSHKAPRQLTSPTGQTSLNDLIDALNQLSKFTTQYLGTHVIVNYWKSTRPNHDWLNNFQIDRSAQVSLIDATPQQLQQPITSQERLWIREWVTAFIKRCSHVIRDFSTLLKQQALNDEQKFLLLG